MKNKIGLKNRIIVLIFTVLFTLSAVSFPVVADDYSGIVGVGQNDVNFITTILDIAKKLVSGDMSVSDAFSSATSAASSTVSENVKDMFPFSETNINNSRDLADKIATSVRQGLRDMGGSIDDNTITTDNVDMKGAGCFVLTYLKSDLNRAYQYFYCDYLVVRPGALTSDGYSVGNDNLNFNFKGLFLWQIPKSSDPTQYDVNESYNPAIDFSNSLYNQKVIIYGDVRYSDGSSADGISSPIQSITQGIDTSQMTNEDLYNLLQDMIDKINLQFPDLSTVEGLLRSILSQCKAINNKIANGEKADYSDIQKYINTAISSLATKNDANTQKLVDELAKLRLATGGSVADNKDLADILGLPDLDIGQILDKETGEIKSDVVQGIIDNLTDLLPSVNLDFPTVADVEKLGIIEIKMVAAFADLATSLDCIVPLSVVNGLLTTMQGVCFSNGNPSDLDFYIDGVSYTLIPAAIIEHRGFASAILIIRSLVGFIILYSWLKWVRQFMLNMI